MLQSSIDSCLECPEGHYCREGDEHPTPCDAGYFCVAGSKKQYACTPDKYCPALSMNETNCPESFHCPSYRTDIYAKCTNGTYCPESSRFETQCRAGYFGSSKTNNIDLNSGCIACGKGQYSDAGTNTCEDCWAGFVC